MNKMHSLARIVVVAMGLFFILKLIEFVVMFTTTLIFMCFKDPSRPVWEVITVLISSLFSVICTGVLCYVCLFRHEQLAGRIIGTIEPVERDSQIDWLPVAFRLACVVAGLYLLYTVLWGTLSQIHLYFYSKSQSFDPIGRLINSESLLRLFVPLPIGIYLVCGAPHFVRWHVKKTIEQCRLYSPETDDSK
ncbi:MAG: hypothetical protein JSW59_03295 [Phycisphaerales bacterium]|nr:MAG: hypothetical protein JSW59_03295 [Phycisphaerales bacterium]